MSSNRLRPVLWAALLAATLHALPGRAQDGQPRVLEDDTVAQSWQLANGLRVTSRHVPRTQGIAVTLCYGFGSDDDPVGKEGLGALLAELALTGPAGEFPERTRLELESQRPLGWNLKVAPRQTLVCEIASVAQLPGVLLQVARRLRGIDVNEGVLRNALVTVKRDLANAYERDPELKLRNTLRLLASGRGLESASRYAAARGLERISVKEARDWMSRVYVPANAVLAIAGNLSSFDIRRLVENEFGGIPAGAPFERPQPRITPGAWKLGSAGLSGPLAGVAIVAPALADSTHPSFLFHTLILASVAKESWKDAPGPLSSRFDYAVLDEPDLVRFYPPLADRLPDSISVGIPLWTLVSQLPPSFPEAESSDKMEFGMAWMLGGVIPDLLQEHMRSDPGMLFVLTSGMALREFQGGETFWAEYRRRFSAARDETLQRWAAHYLDPGNSVELRLNPTR